MSLAITEKRQQQQQRRPGGCVGIFLLFLDWNRRLAKKKLNSKKLPPPVHTARRVSRKFGVDEKMPIAKLILIADENRGSFPSKKKMEVEVGNGGMRAPGLVARLMGLDSMPVVAHERPRKSMDSEGARDLGSGSGGIEKTESRPPKLRKTGEFLLQRQPAEHLQLVRQNAVEKNAMPSRSSSKHHKLVSPVKSPRLLSGSNRARLMQAATKILEPGSQQRYHAKSSITHVDSSLARVETTGPAADCSKKPDELIDGPNLRSCVNCGSLGSSAFQFSIASPCTQDVQKSRFDPFVQAQVNAHTRLCELPERKHQLWNHQNGCKLKPNGHNNFKGNSSLRQNQPLLVKEKVADQIAYGAKECIRKAARQNNLDELRRCTKSTGQVSNTCSADLGRIGWEKNLACKRKNMNQDGGVFGSSYRCKRGFPNNQTIHGKYTGGKEDRGGLSNGCNDSISFAINSQLMNSAKSSSLNVELVSKNKLWESMSSNLGSERRMISRGERMRSLVEQRISNDELETKDALSRASILEELITSLTTGAPLYTIGSSNTYESHSLLHGLSDFSNPQHQTSGVRKEPQKKAKSRTAVGFMSVENDQLSPVSILKASFSNDTCSYGSIQACSVSGNQSQFGMTEKKHSATQSMDMDIDHLDSTSEKVQHSTDKSVRDHSIHSSGTELSTTNVSEAKQTISNPWIVDFAVESFILDTLESIVGAFLVGQNTRLSYNHAKGKDQVRQCLLDCMSQSLTSKYSHLCKAGWKNSSKTPFFQTPNSLVSEEVYDEIRGWINLAGKLLDELIEKEMSDSNVIWQDREIEVFETGVEIERQILQTLVDEMVKDF